MVKKPSLKAIPDPLIAIGFIKGDIFKIKPTPYNKHLIRLLLVNRKTRYKWLFLLPNKKGLTIFTAVKGFFKSLNNRYKRYLTRFYFNKRTKINS